MLYSLNLAALVMLSVLRGSAAAESFAAPTPSPTVSPTPPTPAPTPFPTYEIPGWTATGTRKHLSGSTFEAAHNAGSEKSAYFEDIFVSSFWGASDGSRLREDVLLLGKVGNCANEGNCYSICSAESNARNCSWSCDDYNNCPPPHNKCGKEATSIAKWEIYEDNNWYCAYDPPHSTKATGVTVLTLGDIGLQYKFSIENTSDCTCAVLPDDDVERACGVYASYIREAAKPSTGNALDARLLNFTSNPEECKVTFSVGSTGDSQKGGTKVTGSVNLDLSGNGSFSVSYDHNQRDMDGGMWQSNSRYGTVTTLDLSDKKFSALESGVFRPPEACVALACTGLPSPSPTPLPTESPTPSPTSVGCLCQFPAGNKCVYNASLEWPHSGHCSLPAPGQAHRMATCDCVECPSQDPKKCLGAPTPAPPSVEPHKNTAWELEGVIIVFIVLLLILCAFFIIVITCFFGLRKLRAKIATRDRMATSLEDPLLYSTGSINDDNESSVWALVDSIEAGKFSAAADTASPLPLPPSQKKKARADTSHLASARIDPAYLSPFLNDADEPILLGRGGFGAVFLANFYSHDDVVAVKMVRDLDNPRAVAMFRKEYRLHLRLSMRCEGVCRMFGICENHPLFKTCFVMKRYKCSLLDEIRAVPGGGGIAMGRVLELGATLARTMASLHIAHNLIVADLKPSNILIDEDGAPVISDFGVSRVVATTMGSFGVTANKVGGTYNLESPEQLAGEDHNGNPLRVTMQSDVWSFACTLVHALTGVPPWWDAANNTLRSYAFVMRKVSLERSAPPELGLALALPDVSPSLNVLLSECFAFDADLRPAFFSDFKVDGDDPRTPARVDPLDFGQLGIAVILARLRDRGVPAGGYHGDGGGVAPAPAAYAVDAASTGPIEEEEIVEVTAIRDDIKDAIAAAMAALVDYEDNEGW